MQAEIYLYHGALIDCVSIRFRLTDTAECPNFEAVDTFDLSLDWLESETTLEIGFREKRNLVWVSNDQ